MMLPGAYSSIDCPGMEPVRLGLAVVALLTVIHVDDVLAAELAPGPAEVPPMKSTSLPVTQPML